MPNKKALLVGIDQYPDPRNTLNSCVADTLAFRNQVLIRTYGFDPGDIRVLHNSDATYDNVTAELKNLVAGAEAGDQLVFFESSHGYRYASGDTMVEVLCLYDRFLPDTDLVALTASVPPDTLTCVLDACHSGGMEKLFIPSSGPTVARAKVFLPPPETAAANLQLLGQVSRFRFFARPPVSASGAVADQLSMPGENKAFFVAEKDFTPGADLAGVLFAACQADQTAAAGTPATNNLSAFTYAITQNLDRAVSLSTLCADVGATLARLNLAQTTVVEPPTAHPEMATDTFIDLQPVVAVPLPHPLDVDVLRRALSGATT